MTTKQLQVYGARIRYAWFLKAKELGSASLACRYFGIPRSSFYYWHKKWIGSEKKLTSLYDQPKTPHSHPATITGAKEELILKVRKETSYGKKNLAFILARDYGTKVSEHGVNNVLGRSGVLRKVKKRKRERRLSGYVYYPGEKGQLDVKHWHRVAYQYDIIDCATKIKYKRLYDNFTPENTVDFLKHALKFLGPAFRFVIIRTDNGSEFTYKQFPQIRRTHPVDTFLDSEGIEHLCIKASSPHLNGFIERSHGVDKRGFRYTEGDLTYRNLKEFLIKDCARYNTYRPHQSLDMKTPMEYLRSIPGFEHATINFNELVS